LSVRARGTDRQSRRSPKDEAGSFPYPYPFPTARKPRSTIDPASTVDSAGIFRACEDVPECTPTPRNATEYEEPPFALIGLSAMLVSTQGSNNVERWHLAVLACVRPSHNVVPRSATADDVWAPAPALWETPECPKSSPVARFSARWRCPSLKCAPLWRNGRATKRAVSNDSGAVIATHEERIAPQTSLGGALLGSAFGEARVAARSAYRLCARLQSTRMQPMQQARTDRPRTGRTAWC